MAAGGWMDCVWRAAVAFTSGRNHSTGSESALWLLPPLFSRFCVWDVWVCIGCTYLICYVLLCFVTECMLMLCVMCGPSSHFRFHFFLLWALFRFVSIAVRLNVPGPLVVYLSFCVIGFNFVGANGLTCCVQARRG